MSDERLQRIESKLDQLADTVVALARVEEKIDDLETRRKESHERVNRLSSKIDDVHVDIHRLEVKVNTSEKIMWGIGAAFIAALINELFKVI